MPFDPLVAAHRAGVRWCVGWPLLLSRLIAAAARGLRRLDDATWWCDVAAEEAASQRAVGDAARVDLERAGLAATMGDEATAHRLAAESALVFDRLGMLPLHQHAVRLAGGHASEERVLRTVLFTDLVDSTATNVLRGDEAYVELLDLHNAILRRRLRQFDGVEMKHTGDGLSAWFTSATSACECACSRSATTSPTTTRRIPRSRCTSASASRQVPRSHASATCSACPSRSPLDSAPRPLAGQVLVSTDVTAAIEGSRLSVRAHSTRWRSRGSRSRVAVFAIGVPAE